MIRPARGLPGRRARSGKVNLTILFFGLLVAIPFVWLMVISFGRDPRAVPSVLVGKTAPAFDLERLDGKGRVSLADLQGHKAVVNFWATWCVPCKLEEPVLKEAAQEYPQVRFLGVIYEDEPSKVRSYLLKVGRPYPNLVDPGGGTSIEYGVAGVPETYFIDEKGLIYHKAIGPLSWDDITGLLGAP